MIERYGVLNDIHFPYEDRQRYEIALRLFSAVGISHLYLNGDIGEFSAVSTHPQHPADKMGFNHEVDYCNKQFDALMERFPGVPVTYLCGNHEYRFFRYVRDLAPHLWGLIDCPSLLKFPDRPLWKFVDYGPSQLVRCGKSRLYLRHEPLGMGMSPAKQTADASVIDIAFGHTHRYQAYSHKKLGHSKSRINTAYSLGWLGDPSRNIFDYRGGKDHWVRGCTVVECDTDTGEYSLEFINLETIPALYRGKRYDLK